MTNLVVTKFMETIFPSISVFSIAFKALTLSNGVHLVQNYQTENPIA